MKRLKAKWLLGCAVCLLVELAFSGESSGPPPAAKVRIGTYDSRSVAIAFAGSAVFNEWMGDLKARHDKAKASGDQKRVAELAAEGAARQRVMHTQGFSTAPVTDILDRIKDKLPAIKEKAGVSELVSKWDKDGLAQHKAAELVDVTMALVDAFSPDERQRRNAIEIQKHKPLPLEQAQGIKD
jgi:hypothetical protein